MGFVDKMIQTLSGGVFSIGGMINVSAAGIVTENDKFFTQQGVSKIYQVNEMKPVYADDLISKITSNLARLDKSLAIKTYFDVTNCSVSINTPQYTRRMNTAIKNYLEFKTDFEKLPIEIQKSGIYHDNGAQRWSFTAKDVLKRKHRYDSYVDVSNHLRQENGVYFLVSLFITVVYKDLELCQALDSQVANIISAEVQKSTNIHKNIATLLSSFSPSTLNTAGTTVSTMLVSEENLTHLLPFRSEGVLSTRGIPLGTNVGNYTPLWIDLFSKPEGAATIICAKAGKGKSFMGYIYALQLIGAANTVIYIDLKGTEVYQCMKQAMDNIIQVDFSEKSSLFVNTMLLSKFVPDYTMEDAIKVTSEMLSIFVNINENTEGNPTDVLAILRHAIQSYYNEVGVVSGVTDTYDRSEEMNYLKLISYIGNQMAADDSGRLTNLYEIITERLTEAILQYKMKNNDNALKLDELFGYSAIVFSFNKNEDVSVSLVDQVRIYMVMMVSKRLAKYNKEHELFTIVMAEEGQRYLSMPAICRGISDLASGSRSDNLNVTMIMNDLATLEHESLSSFRSNVANFIIGSCDQKTVDILKNVFAKEKLAADVSRIIRNAKRYERTFAVHFEIGTTEINSFVRCDIPEDIAEMFATRTVIVEDV